jgi:hypothetical protein
MSGPPAVNCKRDGVLQAWSRTLQNSAGRYRFGSAAPLQLNSTETRPNPGLSQRNSMKKLFALIALITSLTGLSVAQGAAPIEGRWGMQQSSNGFQFDMTFTIQNNTFMLTNVCTFRGQSAAASVSSPAQYDEDSITVLTSAHSEQSNNGVNCEASLHPDTMNYVVQGNFLIFSKPGHSEQIVLTRR